ncbi:MAG TPA: lysophospholipid acyltransferase family protein [Burkholderiaceae bacterium]|nr:lysophospholipid acyltransferase family protein [Burkholderiaceae bacterium]
MKSAQACWKLLRVLGSVFSGFLTIVFVFPRLSQEKREYRVQAWAIKMLSCLAIKLVVKGKPPVSGPVLLAANHISWLDILVMHAARHCRFVSKSDVKHWPLIGTLATGAGTLYIERESRRDAMRVVHHMAESLRSGDVLAVFPEGTTSNGVDLLPFHANLIQAAISAGSPVQPVALSFVDRTTGQTSLAPCYIDDDTLVGSIWRTLRTPNLVAVVTFGETQLAEGRDRRAWAAELRNAIAGMRSSS